VTKMRIMWRTICVIVLIVVSAMTLVGCKAEEGEKLLPPATIIRADESAPEQEAAPTAADTPLPVPPTLPSLPDKGTEDAYPYPYPFVPQEPAESPTPVVYPSPTLKK